jgi:hypothetical protein
MVVGEISNETNGGLYIIRVFRKWQDDLTKETFASGEGEGQEGCGPDE